MMFEGSGERRRTPPGTGVVSALVVAGVLAAVAAWMPAPARAAGAGAASPVNVDPYAAEIKQLESQLQKDPKDPAVPTKLGELYLARAGRRGDFRDLERAAAAAEQAIQRQAKHVPALVLLGSCRLAQFRFDDAIGRAEHALSVQPDSRDALLLHGDARRQSGDLVGAREDVQKLLDAKQDAVTLSQMAELQWDEGEPAAAIASAEAALADAEAGKAPPAMIVQCLVRLGGFRFRTGDWDGAEPLYRRAVELAPDDPDALDHLAELLAARGQFDEAAALLEKAKPVREASPVYQRMRGDLCAAMGKHEDAVAWHDPALAGLLEAAAAGHLPAYRHLVAMYGDVDAFRSPADAVRWARRDVQVRRTVDSLAALAWALYQDGKPAEAIANMDKALRDKTADATLLYRAGLVYSEGHDKNRGRLFLRRAATVNPKFQEFHFHR